MEAFLSPVASIASTYATDIERIKQSLDFLAQLRVRLRLDEHMVIAVGVAIPVLPKDEIVRQVAAIVLDFDGVDHMAKDGARTDASFGPGVQGQDRQGMVSELRLVIFPAGRQSLFKIGEGMSFSSSGDQQLEALVQGAEVGREL